MTAAAVVLGLLAAILLCRLLLIKRQMRTIADELNKTREPGYDRQISITLADRDLEHLTAVFNDSLLYQRELRFQGQRNEQILRQSVSDLAHDLRTPLTVLNGNLQMLAQEKSLSDTGRDYLTVCRRKAEQLRSMADAFFEMALLESGSSLAPVSERVNLSAQLMQLLADHEPIIRLNGLEPELHMPERAEFENADPALVQLMLNNLLSNVLKYAQDSLAVKLEQTAEGCRIVFTNPVMPGDLPDPAQMFARSYRADPSRSGGSAGLGLYIVRLLAEKQGAKVSADMQGGCLAVTLLLPAAP